MTIHQFLILAADKIDAGSIGVPAVKDPNSVLNNVLNTVYTWAGIICVLVIVIAGILYSTSAADAAQVKRAKNAIIYSVVGLIVIFMAFAITQFILGRI